MAYENGVSKIQEDARDDLFWFTCKVMPAVQKKYKPIWVDEALQDYYNLVTPSDGAFGFFAWSTTRITLATSRGRPKNKKHQPMMLQESGKIKSEGKNFRRPWESMTTGTRSLLRSRKIKIAISVAISSCFVGNSTTAIKKKRNWKIMVKTP